MNFTAEQLHKASLIDANMRELTRAGERDEMALFAGMADFLPDFKCLMDTATPGMLDELGRRFDGFYVFSKILETIAADIKSGRLKVPK